LLSKHQTHSSFAISVQCSNISGQGRGLVTTQTVRRGQVALSIPFGEAITPEKAAQMSSLRDLISSTNYSSSGSSSEGKTTLPGWTLLAVWLAELVFSQSSNTPDAFSNNNHAVYAAYAAVLPTYQTTGCVLEWTEDEVNWLRGSHLHTIALDIRAAAETSWKELEPIVCHAERAGFIEKGVLTGKTVNHAFALLLSRLIRINFNNCTGGGSVNYSSELGQIEVEVLCPVADFVNHDSACSSFLQIDQENENIVLVADRQYRPGDQIFCSYGQKTSGEMLLSYGFLPEEGTNVHDACLIRIGGLGQGEEEQKNSKKVFPLKMGAVPQTLLEALRSAARESSNNVNKSGEQLLVDLCKQKLETYSINLEDAKVELLSLQTAGGSTSGQKKGTEKIAINAERREAVLRILVQEQKILARTIFLMKQQLKQTPWGK
jgi:histone-lysine N-methyltransferase SETD3